MFECGIIKRQVTFRKDTHGKAQLKCWKLGKKIVLFSSSLCVHGHQLLKKMFQFRVNSRLYMEKSDAQKGNRHDHAELTTWRNTIALGILIVLFLFLSNL